MKWRRKPALSALPVQAPTPVFELIKVRQGEEVAHARREARADFERILPASSMAPPTDEQMERWWGDNR